MTFRTKLLLISAFTISGAVALATGAVSIWTRWTFERLDNERRQAVLQQFQRDLAARGADVVHRVERASQSDAAMRTAIEHDLSLSFNEAQALAETQGLDFLDLLRPDHAIVSSAHWPARFGYQNDWLIAPEDWSATESFLTRIPTPEGKAVAIAAVRSIAVGDRKLYVLGARRLDPAFLASLGTVPGMRAMLWFSPTEVFDSRGPVDGGMQLAALAAKSPSNGIIQWGAARDTSEVVEALPLVRRDQLLGVLFAATSLRAQVRLQRSILYTGLIVGFTGILLGVLIGWWTTERVTRPVEQIAAGAAAVANGDWSVRLPVATDDDIGQMARSFNRMTEQLVEQRDRALQAERVAAWRELARRLAHELKNPLFPLQITVENMRKAREQNSPEFDEIFAESTSTLLAELANLRKIVGRFSDFAKMPAPELEPLVVNDVVRDIRKLFEAQFQASRVTAEFDLAQPDFTVPADRGLISRVLQNLVLNALDAMPGGGTLRIQTAKFDDFGRIVLADSGQGLTEEEVGRLFTPYYTTKRLGTGLGLAIVQSVVSDHHGKIAVSSEPGQGTTFTIDLPLLREA